MAAPLKDEPALCRCPHCDRVHEAVVLRSATDWAMQYRRLLLAGWIAVVLGSILAVASLEGAVTAYALEKMTTHGPFGLVVKRRVRVYADEYALVMTYLLSASLLVGLISGVLATIVLHHWRKAAVAVLLALIPAATGSGLAAFWHVQAPELFNWGLRQIFALTAVQVVGALVGVLAGRPLARGLVRLLLPPGWRRPLVFLWFADGKEPRL